MSKKVNKMDTKSVQSNHSKRIKSRTDSGKHEVFVLPPDLLKKLGISIGDINGSRLVPPDVQGIETRNENIGNSPISINCSNKEAPDTSILETASLMKKSVFLSPTFVSTVSNVIPGEVEISGINNAGDLLDVKDLTAQRPDFVPVKDTEITRLVPVSIQKVSNKEDKTNFCENFTANGEYTTEEKNNWDCSHMAPNNGNKEFEVDVNRNFHDNLKNLEHSYDNILHDAHSSKSNTNVEFPVESTSKHLISTSNVNIDNSKNITKFSSEHIISEETIPLSKLKELKSLQSSNINNLTPIPITSIIGPSKQICAAPRNTKLVDSNLNVGTSKVNKGISNLDIKYINNDIDTHVAPNAILPQKVDDTTSRKTDITLNVIENANLGRSNKKVKNHSGDHSINEDKVNIHVKSCNGLNEHDGAIHVGSREAEKCGKTDKYVSDQRSEAQTKVNDIGNHISALNEHECNVDTQENDISLMKDDINIKNSITKYNLKQNTCSKSFSKEVIDSEEIVDNNCRISKSTECNHADSNILVKHKEDKNFPTDELADILSKGKEISRSDTNIKADKVKEIAAYLKKFSHIYKDKNKIKNELGNDIIKKETINSNASTIKSKLSIQGVEKPGGRNIDKKHSNARKVVKTYTRRNLNKSKISTNILHSYESYNVGDSSNYELNTVNIVMPTEMEKFCLCSDFGRLAYYDNDKLYEHLHFWQHDTVNCESELIFSIYSDEVILKKYENELEQEEKTEEIRDINNTHNVCWNIFQNEPVENSDNVNQVLTCHSHVKNTLIDESEKIPQLTEKERNSNKKNSPDVCDQVQMIHSSDIISETIGQAMVDSEKPLDTYENDKINSAGITAPISKKNNSKLSTSEKTLMDLPENCRVKEWSSTNIKENTYSKKSQLTESRRNAKEELKEAKLDPSKRIEKVAPKRRLSGKKTLPITGKKVSEDEPSSKKNVKCGLCNTLLSEMEWEDHVTQQHHLIAWKEGSSFNMEDPVLLKKLKRRLKTIGMLTCSICQKETKKLKKFIAHVTECIQQKLLRTNKNSNKPTRKSRIADENVTCGVCQITLPSSGWIEHIGKNHSYLAWNNRQPALNLQDEAVVWQHLQNIVRSTGSLTCYKCGFNRSRVKLYLQHIKTCDGSGILGFNENPISVDLNCTSTVEEPNVEQSDEVIHVKCGVCKEDVNNLNWIEHIAKEHKYMAWQEGHKPLNTDDEEAVWNHLQQFIRQNGGLTCHKCGLNRRRVKLYLTHIETCDGSGSQGENSFSNISTDKWFEVPIDNSDDRKVVKCAVCNQEVAILEWVQHIGKEHNYLAWQDGSAPLNLDDESELRVYLLNVSKQIGGLACNKCEKIIKYPKIFLQHVKECNGPRESPTTSKLNSSVDSSYDYYSNLKKIKVESVTCGVCANKVDTNVWLDHLQKVHQYMAWIEGQTPLDLNDAGMVQNHLYDVSKMMGGLVCMKCGVRRKYVKTYQQHVDTCEGNVGGGELSIALMKKDILECAVCFEKVEPKNWRNHAMTNHYNIAWVVGDVPIDINNPYAVESYLKEYLHKNNKLVCKVCGISRVSRVGFYAHIITCGKTEEQTEMYKSVCDICHNKYLRIYKSQHMTMHREQEYALERKLLAAKEKQLKKEETVEVIVEGGRRKAAERAKNVIEKYKHGFHDGSHYHCDKCGFSSEIEKELSDHVCVESKWDDGSDSDESVKLEMCSDDESEETDVDSNVSDEERVAREKTSHKKRYTDPMVRVPYQVKSVSAYMKKSTEEFIETYLTDEDLFTQWRRCEYKEVLENEVENYMPPIEVSCKVRFDENQDWMSFNRFESNKIKDTIVMFLGACIQCMSWVPSSEADAEQEQYLCVGTHLSADAPRLAWDLTPAARGLIQIWDCANLMSTTPKLVLGIAHDYGTVWAIDWCPSGARDVFDLVPEENERKMRRLGLLAAACSNGSAYIFMVPYPSSITEKDKLFYKLKPVAELRLVSNESRKVYQASAIKWSTQKGHSHVVVGYADGTTAYYDLNSESPILKKTENNMTIFYPYHDERVQNSCIEDVDIYPAGEACSGRRGGGAVVSGSAGGAAAALLQSHLSAARVLYPPHWPAALLAGDDCLVNQSINELEWWGGGRRLGGARVAAGCAWCGRVAAAALPLLRLMRLHPCFADVHKQVIGTIQMAPLGNKRKRQTDELAMIVEPITYSEAVNKYGIEFKQITARDRTTQQKYSSMPREAYAERFPLSDVAALRFCPTFRHHHKLALAMHAGLVFIINV